MISGWLPKQALLKRLIVTAVVLLVSMWAGAATAQQPKPVASTRLEDRINGEKWTGDLDGIAKRRILRILVVPTALGFYFNGSQMQGAMYDLGRELERTQPKAQHRQPDDLCRVHSRRS